MKKNLVVIFGGKSTEHDISILTAIQLMNAVEKNKYNLLPVYITKQGEWFCGEKLLDAKFYTSFEKKKIKQVSILPNSNYLFVKRFNGFKKWKKVDCAIISCHGKNGEDGTIQGLLELSNIPYQSSGVDGSAIGLNKSLMKQIFAYNNIPITEFVEVEKNQFQTKKQKENTIEYLLNKISLPVVAKPNRLGSSIGISVCKTEEELFDALELAFLFDEKVLVEKCVENLKEVNISVLGDDENITLSQTEEIQNKGFLSFDRKYLSNNISKQNNLSNASDLINDEHKKINNKEQIKNKITNIQKTNSQGQKNGMQNMDRIIPANITKQQSKEIGELSIKIFKCVNAKGVVRIDYMIDTKTNKIYANEINTIPGSFAFYLWEKKGINFSNLIDKLVEIAEREHKKKNSITTIFESNVLSQDNVSVKK